MRGLGRLAAGTSPFSAGNHHFLAASSHAYCTFSGRGRGRGRGAGSSPASDPLGKPRYEDDREDDDEEAASAPVGLGHGHVQPPVFPAFSRTSTLTPTTPPPQPSAAGRGRVSPAPSPPSSRPPSPPPATGRGRGGGSFSLPHFLQPSDAAAVPKRPFFFRRDDYIPDQLVDHVGDDTRPRDVAAIPPGLSFGLHRGAIGRGRPARPARPATPAPIPPPGENRHLRPRSPSDQRAGPRPAFSPVPRVAVDREEATKKAMDILSRGGRGEPGRGGFRGRGELGWRGRGGRFGGRGRARDPDEYYGTGLYLGVDADGEKLAKRLGEENMGMLKEAFEEMSGRVLPSPIDDAYVEALHTNYSFEFEPEYHMEFNTNPDIDEKPPIPLPEALEKMKPFLMEYEGIKSQEEWEEVMKETMEKAPTLKELVDFYSGPDRVTAKQQHQELERVAKTLPENIPSSVKRFTDRAILSLQSNPGWGFGKKCQFMDKLVWEVSQHYK